MNGTRKRLSTLLLPLLVALFAIDATAQVEYCFENTTGSRITGAFTFLQNGSQAGAGQSVGINPPSEDLINIGFTFNYNGTDFTQVSVNSNGVLTLGGTVGSPGSNSLGGVSTNVIAPFWDQMRLPGGNNNCALPGRVQYLVSGSSPNRVLVVDFENASLTDGFTPWAYAPVIFQVRLYETSNDIEFYYHEMDPTRPGCTSSGASTANTTASIGLATATDFISISPNGSAATFSRTTANNSINLSSTGIDDGVLYRFEPVMVTGNLAEGGTADMDDGDTLLVGKTVVIAETGDFDPFTLHSCAPNHSFAISGPNAGDYAINPDIGPIAGGSVTPTISFTPSATGPRYATLDVTDDQGSIERTYTLAGEGIPRITWIGNSGDGGTPGVMDGDTLMSNIGVQFGDVGTFMPLTLDVAGSGPPAPVSYTLIDPTGYFSIDPTNENIPAGSSGSVEITFRGDELGVHEATLVVNAEGEERTYLLRPTTRGAGGLFYVGVDQVTPGTRMFPGSESCIGVQVITVEVEVRSTGTDPLYIQAGSFYAVDNSTPPFELIRDGFGQPVMMQDYFLGRSAGSSQKANLPIIVPAGTTRTMYMNFLATRNGLRRARAFIQSNAVNFTGIDTDGDPSLGTLNFELGGHGIGSFISHATEDRRPGSLVFDPTDVRDTAVKTAYIRNTGECDLFISRSRFRLITGDVDEFEIIQTLSSPVNGEDNFVLRPGRIDSFTVRFIPSRSGSRRASIQMQTNDSSLIVPGVTERGAHYFDVYGSGRVGLEARPVTLPPAVIDGPGSTAIALAENTSPELVEVISIQVINGTGEIDQDPANPWPTVPFLIEPGEVLSLGLAFNAAPGSQPGERTATLEVKLSNGEDLLVPLNGIAGTRLLEVQPASLFQNLQWPVGDATFRFAILSNTGTLPVIVSALNITGPNAGDYEVLALDRSVIPPGQFEFVEIAFAPQAVGQSSGMMEIVNNATNGPHTITLGGEGTSTSRLPGGESSGTAVSGEGGIVNRQVNSAEGSGIVSMRAVTPNPTDVTFDVRYSLPADASISIELFDAQGELIRRVVSNEGRTAGMIREKVATAGLASGTYHVVLTVDGVRLSQSVRIVR